MNVEHKKSILEKYKLALQKGERFWPDSIYKDLLISLAIFIILVLLASFLGVWALSRLPRYHHPVFNVARFRSVSDDKFFILIECSDPKFDLRASKDLLASTHPAAIDEVKD